MTFDYFTPGDAEQYAYYSTPKMLIKGEQFRGISMEAKLLYGILLDRVSLSLKHGWVDENKIWLRHLVRKRLIPTTPVKAEAERNLIL